MRILWATYNYYPERYGGTEVYVASTTRILQHLGHSIHLIAGSVREPADPSRRSEPEEFVYDGLPVTFLRLRSERFTRREFAGSEAADLTAWWSQWLERHPCDLLHLHGHSLACSNSLILAAKRHRIPIAVSFHHPGLVCARGNLVQAWGIPCDGQLRQIRCSACFGLTKLSGAVHFQSGATQPIRAESQRGGKPFGKTLTAITLPWQFGIRVQAWKKLVACVDGWHAFSEESKQLLIRNGVAADRITTIPHGIDPITVPERRPSDKVRIGFIGRFDPEKGIHLLVQAIRRIPKSTPVRFIFYGEAQDETERPFQKEVESLASQDSRVCLKGPFQRAEIGQILANLDVLAVPSLVFETGPLVALEAFQAGLPVIGTRWGSIPSLVQDGVNGLLFPWGDSHALARCIQQVVSKPTLLAQLQRGIHPSPTTEDHVQAVLGFYRCLLREFRGGSNG